MSNHPNRGRFTAHIICNTNLNSHSLSAYHLNLYRAGEEEPTTGRLEQQGPNHNNKVFYKGTFATRRQAFEAIGKYVSASFAVVEADTINGSDLYFAAFETRTKQTDRDGFVSRVVYRHSKASEFFAER